jgi:uncharacterized damage-inducible protein DinB
VNALLSDLLRHQLWADAELWNALAAHPAARNDAVVHHRLHHTHLVQRLFVYAVGGRATPPQLGKADDFATFDDLNVYARESHDQITNCVAALSDDRLAAMITMPWLGDPAFSLTVEEALAQMAMHSQHHRAQNATRLRELGGTPPTLDLIVWYLKKRPASAWQS